MAFVGIQQTVNLYSMEQAQLTNKLSDIMMEITTASGENTKLVQEESAKKKAVKEQYDTTDAEYDVEMSEIEDDYELKLAKITEWESELEVQKESMETQVQAITSYKESFTSALKQNVAKDFKYAQNK